MFVGELRLALIEENDGLWLVGSKLMGIVKGRGVPGLGWARFKIIITQPKDFGLKIL